MTANILIATIMQLAAELYKQEILLNIETGEILRKKITEEGTMYYPLTYKEEGQIPPSYLFINENNLLSTKEVVRTEKNGKNWNKIGLKTNEIRITQRIQNGTHTEENQTEYGQKSENKQTKIQTQSEKKQTEIFRYYKIEKISKFYSGELQARLIAIENLTVALLNNTNKQKTIDGIIRLFQNTIQFAKKENIYELDKIIKTLQGKYNRQLAMLEVNKNQQKNLFKRIKKYLKKISDKAKIFLVVTSIGIAILLGIITGIKNKNNTPKNTTNTTVFSNTQIDSLINVYEFEHNTKIYVWRRNKIKAAFLDIELTEQETIKIIDSIANYNFKANQPQKTTLTQQNKQPTSYSTDDNGIGYNPNIQTNYTN